MPARSKAKRQCSFPCPFVPKKQHSLSIDCDGSRVKNKRVRLEPKCIANRVHRNHVLPRMAAKNQDCGRSKSEHWFRRGVRKPQHPPVWSKSTALQILPLTQPLSN